MDLRQLRYYIAAAEELHFQRAARRVHLTQPALSHQIKVLEEELGVTLLDRDRKRVELTRAGEVFLKRAKEILAAVDRAVRETQDAAGLENQTLKIGTTDYLNLHIIAHSVMNARTSGIGIDLIEMPTSEVFEAVKERRIDLAFGPGPVTHPTLVTRKIVEGYWSIILPKTHPLASGKKIDIASLNGQPLIIFDKALNPKLHGWCLAQCRNAGFEPKIVLETKQVQTALRMVSEGMALYWVASYIVEKDLTPHLVCRPLTGFKSDIGILAVWHETNKSKALKNFLKILREV